MKTHLHVIVQGYAQKDDTGNLIDCVTLDLIDASCESALNRAKKMVKKNNYRVGSVIEHLDGFCK